METLVAVLPADLDAGSPEGASAAWTATDTHRALRLMFAGRLDNGAEVRQRLGLGTGVSDATAVLEALALWGPSAPARFLGDYAFLFWDQRNRVALLGRDHLGVRTLFFSRDRQHLACASTLPALRPRMSGPLSPDETWVARYLSSDPPNDVRTPYREIRRVPPAHVVVVDPQGERAVRYWDPLDAPPIVLRDDREYADRCRDLVLESVRARLPPAPAALTVSGGIDSSVVTIAAAASAAIPPTGFSMVFPHHPECDERQFIERLGPVLRGPSHACSAPANIGRVLAGWAGAWECPPASPSDALALGMWQSMHAAGFRVSLTGAGGDFLFDGSPFAYADLIRHGRVGALVRRYTHERSGEVPASPFRVLQAGLWPALPPSVKRSVRPAARWLHRRTSEGAPRGWLRLAPDGHAADAPREEPRTTFAAEHLARSLTGGQHSMLLESASLAAAEAGIELRHPLLDPRLVEFGLAIPDGQRLRGGLSKFVLRQAFAAELPPEIRLRRTKADFSFGWRQAVQQLGGRGFFADLAIAERNWVSGRDVLRLYDRMDREAAAADGSPHFSAMQLWEIASIELWHRAAFSNAAHYNPATERIPDER